MPSVWAHIHPQQSGFTPLVRFAVKPVSQVPLCPKGSPEAHQGCRLAWSLKWGSKRWAGQHFWCCSLEWLTAWMQSQVEEDYSLLLSADQSSPPSKSRVSNCHLCRLQGSQTCSRAHYHHLGSINHPVVGQEGCSGFSAPSAFSTTPTAPTSWWHISFPPPWAGTAAPCTGNSHCVGGPQAGGCQALSHRVTFLHNSHLCEPSCGSALLTRPRSHQGHFRGKQASRRVWKTDIYVLKDT